MKNWYSFKAKDGSVQGFILAKDENAVVLLFGYPRKELVIDRVEWNGRKFVKCQKTK